MMLLGAGALANPSTAFGEEKEEEGGHHQGAHPSVVPWLVGRTAEGAYVLTY